MVVGINHFYPWTQFTCGATWSVIGPGLFTLTTLRIAVIAHERTMKRKNYWPKFGKFEDIR